MNRTPTLLVVASLALSVASAAAAADTRYPTSTDEARAFAGRQASEPAPTHPAPCAWTRGPTSTDEARVMAQAGHAADTVVASPGNQRTGPAPASTDEARAYAANWTSTRRVPTPTDEECTMGG